MKKYFLLIFTIFLVSCWTVNNSSNLTNNSTNSWNNLVIAEQWSFMIWWTKIQAPWTFNSANVDANSPLKLYPPDGQTQSADHSYVFYQKPANAKNYPLVFIHWGWQSGKTWESTPDWREWFQNIFLRKWYPVYVLDLAWTARAWKVSQDVTVSASPQEQYMFNFFRLGEYPNYFENVSFPKDENSLDQYFRQSVPMNWFNMSAISDSISALVDKIWDSVLVWHSLWVWPTLESALKNSKVKWVAIYEPGASPVFLPKWEKIDLPKEDLPDSLPVVEVTEEQFKNLTKIPIVIYFWDNIPKEKSDKPILEEWRRRVGKEIVNKHWWNAQVILLPEVWLYWNTHFPFSDTNNLEVAEVLSKWLGQNKLN